MAPTTVLIDGSSCDVVHAFNDIRVIVNYMGLFAIADQAADGSWALTSINTPATPDEELILAGFTAPMDNQSELTVIKPDGSSD